jgi:hypothetical protein
MSKQILIAQRGDTAEVASAQAGGDAGVADRRD